jgi:hypothetical protein
MASAPDVKLLYPSIQSNEKESNQQQLHAANSGLSQLSFDEIRYEAQEIHIERPMLIADMSGV